MIAKEKIWNATCTNKTKLRMDNLDRVSENG